MKKLSVIVAMLLILTVALIPAMSVSAVASDGTTKIETTKGTAVIDGVVDAAWSGITATTLGKIAGNDSKNAENTASSAVTFKTMWDTTNFYILLEIDDDDLTKDVSTTHWKNDSIMLFFSEDDIHTALNSEYSYQLCVLLDGSEVFVRNQGVNTKPLDSATVVTGDAATGFHIVVEISMQFNTITPFDGNYFSFDVQYNDADAVKYPDASQNNRDLVRCWSGNTTNYGPASDKEHWGRIYFKSPEAVTAGANTIRKTSGTGDLVLTTDAADIKTLKINGEVVDAANYTISGSTITVKAAYLATLAAADYSVEVISSTGTASTNLKVETGDIALVLALVAAVSLVGAAVVIKRRHFAA